MTINEMKEKKKEKGYTYAQMSVLSGVPLGTIQKRLPIRLAGMAAILLTTIMHCRMNNV